MKISVYRGKQLRTSFPSICIFQRLHGRKAPLWDPHFSLPTVIRIRSYSLANHSKNSLHEFPSSSNPWNVIIHVQPIPEIVEALSERWKKGERRENDSFSIRLMDIYLRKGIFIINDVRNVKMRKDWNVTCIFVHPRTLYLADHSVFHPLNYDSSYDSRFWVIVPAEERQWDVRGEQKEISFHVWRTKGMKETSCTVLNRK